MKMQKIMMKLRKKGFKMSVSLLEVLEDAGFDIKKNIDDAKWLLSKRNEFEVLCEEAEELEEKYSEYEDYYEEQNEKEEEFLTFEEWLEEENR